jgi:hypothetical protein
MNGELGELAIRWNGVPSPWLDSGGDRLIVDVFPGMWISLGDAARQRAGPGRCYAHRPGALRPEHWRFHP